jgi:hypothetical protein
MVSSIDPAPVVRPDGIPENLIYESIRYFMSDYHERHTVEKRKESNGYLSIERRAKRG